MTVHDDVYSVLSRWGPLTVKEIIRYSGRSAERVREELRASPEFRVAGEVSNGWGMMVSTWEVVECRE